MGDFTVIPSLHFSVWRGGAKSLVSTSQKFEKTRMSHVPNGLTSMPALYIGPTTSRL